MRALIWSSSRLRGTPPSCPSSCRAIAEAPPVRQAPEAAFSEYREGSPKFPGIRDAVRRRALESEASHLESEEVSSSPRQIAISRSAETVTMARGGDCLSSLYLPSG